MGEGFIKLHRKMLEWEWYQNTNVMSLFIHILFLANWEDKQWQGITIKRGSFITSIDHLAKDTGLTNQETRTALDKLISTGEVNKQTTNKYTIVTVNKYNDYQSVNKQITNEQQTNNKQITTTKEYKEIKEYKEEEKTLLFSSYENITEKEITSISIKYQVPESFVKSKLDDMTNWVESIGKPKYYKNYYRALCNWVKKDALKIKQGGTNGKFVIANTQT